MSLHFETQSTFITFGQSNSTELWKPLKTPLFLSELFHMTLG